MFLPLGEISFLMLAFLRLSLTYLIVKSVSPDSIRAFKVSRRLDRCCLSFKVGSRAKITSFRSVLSMFWGLKLRKTVIASLLDERHSLTGRGLLSLTFFPSRKNWVSFSGRSTSASFKILSVSLKSCFLTSFAKKNPIHYGPEQLLYKHAVFGH